MSERLEIQALGGLSIRRGGQPIEFETKKEAALLVYLACTRRTYPREVLAEFLWEDRPQSQSLANLRHVLAQLRQTVGDYVLTADAVALNPDSDWWLDTAEFESQLDRAGTLPQAIESALDLYQGDFLAGFFVDSTAFEQWATHERERLRLRAMQALDTLVICHLKERNYTAGLKRATRLLQMDNLREETHQHLMRLLALSGQRGKALDQYETCRRLLHDELGVEPTPETTDLYQRIKAGELLDDTPSGAIRSYALHERIGIGSFGEVYRAFQAIGDQRREVAVKVIKPDYANQPDFIRRFEMEAQVAARLEHPHIVPLHDYWREPGGAYLVMRCLPTSLNDRLAREPLTLAEGARLVEQIAAALDAAHRQGVIHRDLKPANILLDEQGNAYLTDFGVAKVLGAAVRATQEGALIGSPGYLSPEQVKGEPVTPSSDLYSFGLVLFEALTGQPPFPGDLSPASLLYKQVHEPLPALQSLRPDLPAALDEVLQTATAKDPARRYPDALRLAEAFLRAAGQPRPVVSDTPSPFETRPYRGEDMTWLVAPRNPYKGLHAFEEADAADFFGREALVDQLLARLGEEEDGLGRFLAVIGPSGCGKSSVVKAGLLPALREGRLPGSENWFVASMTPREHPLGELAAALASVAARSTSRLSEQLHADPRGLLWAAESVLNADADLLLVVDQFEELFALTRDVVERDQFLALLHTAVTAPDSRVRVILTLRADFTDRPLEHPAFGALLQRRTEFVLPLTPEELERAVSLPAEQVGLALEPGLAAAIVADVTGQPGALPLLQYALTELYHRRDNHTLTLVTYHALGGTRGALARRADELYTDMTPPEGEAARQMFLRLVTLGEETEDTRRRVHQAELLSLGGTAMPRVMDVFGRARLLTFDHDPATRAPTVEVAHEALIREWDQLRAWLDESRADIRQQRLLAAAAAEWEQAGRDSDYLLAGSRLAQFEDWAARTDIALTPDETAYLDASLAEHERRQAAEFERQAKELDLQRRAARRLRYLVAGLAVFLVAALGLSVFAFGQRNQAQDARATSDANASIAHQERNGAQELALINGAQAALFSDDLDTALALAVAANQVENPPPEAQVILSEAAYRPGTIRVLKGHTSPYIVTVALSPDGRFALSSAEDQTLILWDVDPTSATFGTILDRFEYTAPVWDVAFRPDGRTALFSSKDANLYLIDVDLTSHTLGPILHRFEGVTGGIQVIAISPDGRYAFTCYRDQTPVLWDVDPSSSTFGAALHRFEGHTDIVWEVSISPDGRTALSGANDGLMILWDVDPSSPTFGTALHRFEVGDMVNSVAFSPDGGTALAGGNDEMILWDLETYDIIRRFETGSIEYMVVFNPEDGHMALTAQDDGHIVLWNVETGDVMTRLYGHAGGVYLATFSPDGRRILSGGAKDGLLRLWDVRYGTEMQTIPGPFPANTLIWAVAFSPDGRSVLWGGADVNLSGAQAAILTDVTTNQEIRRFEGYFRAAYHVTFAPDGRTALISGGDGEMILWDVNTGERLHTFTGHMASLVVGTNSTVTAFSPDGRTALSVAKEEQAILWDVAMDSPTFGQPIRHFVDTEGEIPISVSFSPDGRTALTGTLTGPVLLWNVETGEVIYRLTGHGPFSAGGFSPDGRTILTGAWNDSFLILWDPETGQEIRRFSGQKGRAVGAAFSPDGRTIFSATGEGIIFEWDVATGQAIRRYSDAGTASGALLFLSPDGHSFFTTPDQHKLVQWRIDTLDELLAWTLTHRYVRELTCDEREMYQIEPLCDTAGNYPTSTPYLTATPTATPASTPPADLKRTTATPTATVTPTVTPLVLSVAHIGENRGNVAIGDAQFWTYEGRAGEVLTIRVEADHPANWDTRREGEPTPEGGWFDTRLSVTSPEGAILMHGYSAVSIQHNDIEPGKNTNSQVEGLILPVDGTYLVLVSGNLLQTGGAYTLNIASEPPGTITPTLGP
jgi:WD40 repeat protein/DNA-binding SARP family transcriptional activator